MAFNVTKIAPTGDRYDSDRARAMITDMVRRNGPNSVPQEALAAIGMAQAPSPGSAWRPPLPQNQPTTAFGPNVGVGAGVGPATSVAGGPQTGGYAPSPMQVPRQPMQTPMGGGVVGGVMPRQPMQTPVQTGGYDPRPKGLIGSTIRAR